MRFEPMTSTILAPSWLVSSVGRALYCIAEFMGSNPVWV